MATMIYKSEFRFHEITEEFKENFKKTSWHDLSDFQVQALKWAGNAIRPSKSEYFWTMGVIVGGLTIRRMSIVFG